MKAKTGKRNVSPETAKKSVSLPKTILEAAERVAAGDRRTFSNYVATLIERDLQTEQTKGSSRRLAPQAQEVAA